jgi:hypothetical protein
MADPIHYSPNVRAFRSCVASLRRILRDRGLTERLEVDFVHGEARVTVKWKPNALPPTVKPDVENILRRINYYSAKMSQAELSLANSVVYRDVYRPPLVGMIGFEDSAEVWEQ